MKKPLRFMEEAMRLALTSLTEVLMGQEEAARKTVWRRDPAKGARIFWGELFKSWFIALDDEQRSRAITWKMAVALIADEKQRWRAEDNLVDHSPVFGPENAKKGAWWVEHGNDLVDLLRVQSRSITVAPDEEVSAFGLELFRSTVHRAADESLFDACDKAVRALYEKIGLRLAYEWLPARGFVVEGSPLAWTERAWAEFAVSDDEMPIRVLKVRRGSGLVVEASAYVRYGGTDLKAHDNALR